MQAFCESDRKVMVINMPPRHGKSRTAVLLSQWLFGRDPSEQIMTGSYNETLSTTFARSVRDGIAEEAFDPNRTVFSDIFPHTRIKYGEAAAGKWALEGQYASYLATSPGGTATGFGARKLIIDDLIKKAEEAFNENALEKQWQWFTDTMLSRTETGYKIIIIMTRWATNDLAGRALAHWPDAEHITMKALQDDGTMLCDAVLTRADYDDKVRTMSEEIASANYQQEPIDLKGRLYSSFKTYTDIPRDGDGKPLFARISNYTDTADQGSDFLCSIIYGEYNHEAYVLDKLLRELETALSRSFVRGDPLQRTTKQFAERMGVSESRAATLIHTESAHAAAEATAKGYKETGVSEYQFDASLDLKTCAVCGALDGKTFPASVRETGVSYPPIHPRCRCTTVPVTEFDAGGQRAARNPETGKTEYVDQGMTYEDWYEKYVAGESVEKSPESAIMGAKSERMGKQRCSQ